MTGTFDDWTKSQQLEKVGELWQKKVVLPENSGKIYYKVCNYPFPIPHFHWLSCIFLYSRPSAPCDSCARVPFPHSLKAVGDAGEEGGKIDLSSKNRSASFAVVDSHTRANQCVVSRGRIAMAWRSQMKLWLLSAHRTDPTDTHAASCNRLGPRSHQSVAKVQKQAKTSVSRNGSVGLRALRSLLSTG